MFQIPGVLSHNYGLMARELPPDSQIHFCGSGYGLVSRFTRTVVTIHDYYLRLPSLGSLKKPAFLLRDGSSAWAFVTLPRQVKSARERVVPTRYVQGCLDRGCSLSSTVIPHWVDSLRFRPREKREARERLGLPQVATLVLNVSVGASNKNYATLGQIARHLRTGYRMVKVGGRISNGPDVIHLPWLSHDVYPLLFNACDVYAHTSTQEGFGKPLVEAMASELPVVSLRTEVALEVLGEAGTYINSGAPPEEWIRAIERVTLPNARDSILSLARDRLSQFDPELARDAYLRIYRRAFGK